jgi:hypothetical protein
VPLSLRPVMTIEYLQKRIRTINIVKWVGVGFAVVPVFIHIHEPKTTAVFVRIRVR